MNDNIRIPIVVFSAFVLCFSLVVMTRIAKTDDDGSQHVVPSSATGDFGAVPEPVALICLDPASGEETVIRLEEDQQPAPDACPHGRVAILKLGTVELMAGADPLPFDSQEQQEQAGVGHGPMDQQ